ncbi:MAG: type II toxin-antitoxin system RelE/ParE family toxin [Alphaproteobacteria bacterium]|jgi:plasmid stabilization system protein ParE|nr:type II toxin-antitoxin system RelE/ParE family toxin [Alphaproteobacteria bacterium]
MNKVIWYPKASNKYENYVYWYVEQGGISVAKDFKEHITTCINLIANNPYMAKQVEGKPELREYVVRKYPFLISYYVKEDIIAIASFLHQSMKK